MLQQTDRDRLASAVPQRSGLPRKGKLVFVALNRFGAAGFALLSAGLIVGSADSATSAQYFAVQASAFLALFVAKWGLPQSVLATVSAADDDAISAAIGTHLRLATRIGLAVAGCHLIFVALTYPTLTLPIAVAIGAWVWCEGIRSVAVEAIRGLDRQDIASLLGEGPRNAIFTGLLIVTLGLGNGLGLAAIFGLQLIATAVVGVGAALWLRFRSGYSFGIFGSASLDRSSLGLSSTVAVAEFCGIAMMQGPVVVAPFLLSSEDVGVLAIALRLGPLVLMPLAVAIQFLGPRLFMGQRQLAQYESQVRAASTVATGLSLGVGLAVVGYGFLQPNDLFGVDVIAPLLVAYVVSVAVGPTSAFLYMNGQASGAARNAVVSLVCGIVLLLAFAGLSGYIAGPIERAVFSSVIAIPLVLVSVLNGNAALASGVRLSISWLSIRRIGQQVTGMVAS
ncbi:MAG: hypothetical protein HKN26_03170 [Acidimicrobiales bacterium]|nr:hypothetical protein [Acidimicrobiales bacterium]